MSPRKGLRNTLLVLFGLILAWTLAIIATGGFVFHVGGVRVSARRALNPGLTVLATAAAWWGLATCDERRRTIAGV